ncbi:magnesium/cobalt transporter CorA [Gracilibacillus sp. Marseille-QA3620]
MYRMLGKTPSGKVEEADYSLSKLGEYEWVWVDLSSPTKEEAARLFSQYQFHPLAVEDCLDAINQRPKVDFFEDYMFLVIYALKEDYLMAELDLFVSKQFIITYHQMTINAIHEVWETALGQSQDTPIGILHQLIDRVVDEYFPKAYDIEERLNALEENADLLSIKELMNHLYDLRMIIFRIRRVILPMNDLLYRITHTEKMTLVSEKQYYFNDVYDHLLKLREMIEGYRDFSADLRDNYMSVNSNNMNETIMALTIITTIFMPLSFIAGLYGMNFSFMPMAGWKHGFWYVMLVMGISAVVMVVFFKAKGWVFRARVYKRGRNKEHGG